MRRFTTLSLVSVFALLTVALVATAADHKAKAAIGQDAPAFSLQDQDGNTVTLADQKGKVVVLEWFNEGCPIVQRVYKQDVMNKLFTKWSDKGVVWLAVNSTKDTSNASNKKAAGEMKINRPILN